MSMINVYYIGGYRPVHNGCSTYAREFMKAMALFDDVKLRMITFNCPRDTSVINRMEEGIECLDIPVVDVFWANSVAVQIRDYVGDKENVVLLINTTPTADFAYALRDIIPSSRIVYVVHDLLWVSFLSGRSELLNFVIDRHGDSSVERQIVYFVEDVKKTATLVDKIICLNMETYALFNSIYGIGLDKLALIRNGLVGKPINTFNYRLLREKYFIAPHHKIFIAVGSASVVKGIGYILEQFKLLTDEFDDIVLVLIGYRPSKKELANKRVLFVEHTDNASVLEWISIADFGIIASCSEQCSYVGIEMKMLGKRVFASDGFGVRDMFSGKNAYLFSLRSDGYEADSLYGTIKRVLLSEPNDGIDVESRTDYCMRYSNRNMANNYHNLFQNIINI